MGEQAHTMGLVDDLHGTVRIAQQEGVFRQHRAVRRIGVPGPLQIPDCPAVGTVTTAMAGFFLEGLSRPVGHEDRDTAGTAMQKGRLHGQA